MPVAAELGLFLCRQSRPVVFTCHILEHAVSMGMVLVKLFLITKDRVTQNRLHRWASAWPDYARQFWGVRPRHHHHQASGDQCQMGITH